MKRYLIIILLAVLLAPVVYLAWKIASYGGSHRYRKADAAIVLGAAVWKDQPSPVFKERINHAIWLYDRKYVKKIIFTGARDSSNEEAASIVAKRYAEKQRVSPRDILVETRSRTTRENIAYAAQLGGRNMLKSYLIVSDPLHMKRAMLIAREIRINAFQSPTPTSRYRSWGNKIQFLGREVYFYLDYYYDLITETTK